MIPCQAKQSRLTKWIGLVNHYNGGARDLNVWTLLQIADVDTGAIQAVHADLVIKMLTA